eukprot:163819-Amphidinium_carterae.2
MAPMLGLVSERQSWDGISVPTKANTLTHEGTIPEHASRLTMADIILSFGHGLMGLLPSISGTLGLLGLCENGLEGPPQ